jgi:glycine betaine monooxygenase A
MTLAADPPELDRNPDHDWDRDLAAASARCAALVRRRRPWFGLERDWYLDDGIFALENERIFRRGWLLVCFTGEVAAPGDVVRRDLAGESLLITRAGDGSLRALVNTCRHRGARLVTETCLSGRRRIVCPYHQWAYGLDGRLLTGCDPGDVGDGGNRGAYGLTPVWLEEVDGLVFVCLADAPTDFTPIAAAFSRVLAPHRLGDAKVAHRRRYVVEGNWKLVMENQRECYHCPVSHPEYVKLHYDTEIDNPSPALRDEIAARTGECVDRWRRLGIDVGVVNTASQWSRYSGPFYRANRTPLRPGVVTESLDGRPVAPLLGGDESGDPGDRDLGVGRVGSYLNFWLHVSSDHAAVIQYEPLSPTRTAMTATWLVDRRAEAGRDYDVERLVAFTSIQLDQDRELLDLVGAGVSGTHYRPGPYSRRREAGVEDFVRWYLAAIDDAAGTGPALQP